jgi:hypothetical protein
MEPPESATWLTYVLNAGVVVGAMLLAKLTGQIVTKSEVFETVKAACEAVTTNMNASMIERERRLASREELKDGINLAIEAFSKIDQENDRLMVERYTEPLRVLVDRQQQQQERFITTLENLNNNMMNLFAKRPVS